MEKYSGKSEKILRGKSCEIWKNTQIQKNTRQIREKPVRLKIKGPHLISGGKKSEKYSKFGKILNKMWGKNCEILKIHKNRKKYWWDLKKGPHSNLVEKFGKILKIRKNTPAKFEKNSWNLEKYWNKIRKNTQNLEKYYNNMVTIFSWYFHDIFAMMSNVNCRMWDVGLRMTNVYYSIKRIKEELNMTKIQNNPSNEFYKWIKMKVVK